MQDRPLALPHVFHRAEQLFGHKPIVTATAKGEIATTVADWAVRVRRLATALDTLGVPADGRVATFSWNTAAHLELYLAAPCTGRVLHTLNIRLFPEQLVYIANHAEDDVVFVDRSLLPVFLPLRPQLHTVRHVIVIDDGADHPLPDDALDYDELLASRRPVRGPVRDRRREQRRGDVLHAPAPPATPRASSTPTARRPALADRPHRGRDGPVTSVTYVDASRPDVPRQRLGHPIHGAAMVGATQVMPGAAPGPRRATCSASSKRSTKSP